MEARINMDMRPHRRPWAAIVAVLLTLLFAGLGARLSARWIGTAFPGFFVMDNRVVASVSLPHWPVADQTDIYQAQVVAVNAHLVQTSDELYTAVRSLPIGTAVTYRLEKHGETFQKTLPSSLFTLQDYGLLFGAYLFVGLAFALSGIGVWFLTPAIPASRAFLTTGCTLGLFALTAADLYGPHWFFRLHVLSEALLPAGLLHLAFVFPVERLQHARRLVLAGLYGPLFVLALVYEIVLYTPAYYSVMHHLSEGVTGLAGLIFLSKILWDYWGTDSPLVLQRIRVVLLGCLSGYAFPAVLMLASGAMGGSVAVNYTAFTGAIFPLSLGYAIVKHDLFEIDAMLKRGVYYLALSTFLTLIYLSCVGILNVTLSSAAFAQSPLFPLLFAFLVALFLNPLKEVLQTVIDRLFFRLHYNPKKVIEEMSAALATTLQLEDILSLIRRTIDETLGVQHLDLFLYTQHDNQYVASDPETGKREIVPAWHGWVQHLHHKRQAVAVAELEEDRRASVSTPGEDQSSVFAETKLCIPLILKDKLVAFLALSDKTSGASFSVDDITFLSTMANQSAVSIANALAYQEIQELNLSLEKKVEERTYALADAHTELQLSFSQVEQAYRDLQHSQENLVRAEKMAAFGRMTAGMAHEMNTPLGSTLNTLDLVHELVDEYAQSIGDPQVTEQDHAEIAAEMKALVGDTQKWVTKATTYIRTLKLQARGMQDDAKQHFELLQVIEDTKLLLAHQLRLTQCTVQVSGAASTIMLYGDPSKLSQVLTNVMGNAIDAYQEAGTKEGAINITVQEAQVVQKTEGGQEAQERTDGWEIRISDHGCGIPAENLDTIFDEFFSTKPFGAGTGLGLPIVRDIITSFFGGTIRVESVLGEGSTFVIWLPRVSHEQAAVELYQEPSILVEQKAA